jgi:hypothetical protein
MAKFLKVNVTYHAPEGDSKVVEMLGATFYDGQPVDVVVPETVFAKLEGNPHFHVNSHVEHDPSSDKPAPKTGMPKTETANKK